MPRDVEAELRAFLKCGVFSKGFLRGGGKALGEMVLVLVVCE